MRQADSAYKSWLTLPKFPLPSVPSFTMKTDSYSNRTTKPNVADQPSQRGREGESDEL